MRSIWIVVILAILVALGLVMVVQSQYQMKDMMNKKNEMLKTALESLSNEFINQDVAKASAEKVAQKTEKDVGDLDAAINKLNAETEQKKTQNNACQGEMTSAKEEMGRAQKTQQETKASLVSEVEAWTKEIKTLKEALTHNSPVCNYVKKNTQADKLCSNKTTTERIKTEARR